MLLVIGGILWWVLVRVVLMALGFALGLAYCYVSAMFDPTMKAKSPRETFDHARDRVRAAINNRRKSKEVAPVESVSIKVQGVRKRDARGRFIKS